MKNESIEYIAAKIHDEIDPKFKERVVDEINKYDADATPEQVSSLVYNVSAAMKDYMYDFAVKFARELKKKD